jgi:hypothetical protein
MLDTLTVQQYPIGMLDIICLSNVQPPSEVTVNARLCLLPLLGSSKIKITLKGALISQHSLNNTKPESN